MNLDLKEKQLEENLKMMKKVIVAFSGGVDSTYLAFIANRVLGENALAVTLQTEYIPLREIEEAKELAKKFDFKHKIIPLNALSNEKISENPIDRCFFCKTDLFSHLMKVALELDFPNVIDGSNIDDMKEFRPGVKALKNLKITSPLKDAALTKNDIRELSRKYDLPTWDKASFSCLATRIPHGTYLTREKLLQIEQGEDILFNLGLKQFRVRHHDQIARIEVDPSQFSLIIEHHQTIVEEFRKAGFLYTTLDLKGYRTGSLLESMTKESKK